MVRETAIRNIPAGYSSIHLPLSRKITIPSHHQPQAFLPAVDLLFPQDHSGRASGLSCSEALKPHPLPRDVSENQITVLFSVVTDKRDIAIFTLILECGLRVGEVCALSLDEVLFDDPPRLKVHGKGDRQRMVYLPQYPYSKIGSPAARSQRIGRFSFPSMANDSLSLVFNLFCKPIAAKQASMSPATNSVMPSAGAWQRHPCRSPRSRSCLGTIARVPRRSTPASRIPSYKPNTTAPFSAFRKAYHDLPT